MPPDNIVQLKDALAAAGLLSDNSGDEESDQIDDHAQARGQSDDNVQNDRPHIGAQRGQFTTSDE